jgi:hypothetical protein
MIDIPRLFHLLWSHLARRTHHLMINSIKEIRSFADEPSSSWKEQSATSVPGMNLGDFWMRWGVSGASVGGCWMSRY